MATVEGLELEDGMGSRAGSPDLPPGAPASAVEYRTAVFPGRRSTSTQPVVKEMKSHLAI
jgi:hypothetical protein